MKKILLFSLSIGFSVYAMEYDIERNRLLDQIREAHAQRMEQLAQEQPMEAQSFASEQDEFWSDEKILNLNRGGDLANQVQRLAREVRVERMERIELGKQVAWLAAKIEVIESAQYAGGQFPSLVFALFPVACYGAWYLIGWTL